MRRMPGLDAAARAPGADPGDDEPLAQPPAEVSTPPRSRRRWPRWGLRACLIALLLPAIVLAGAEVSTPSVADAPARVAAIDRGSGSVPVEINPSWPIARAIVAAEDSGFYSDHGLDVAGVVRALWGRITGVDLGGSTITQQLAKAIYTQGRTGFGDRVLQVALALKLEGHYTKPAILSMYLSAVYYGHGYFGVLAASEGYFGLPPDRLSWAQASLLAGLPEAPTRLDPLSHLSLARGRQGYVLGRLVATGVLTEAQADAAAQAPLGLR